MTRRLAAICFITVFLTGVSSQSIQAQGDDLKADTLKGISAIGVMVEDLPDGAKVIGLTADAIRTDVELKLRLAGMCVVTMQEDLKVPGSPHLYVRVSLLDRAEAGSIEVQLTQDAVLRLNGQLAHGVVTWDKTGVVANPTAQFIRDRIKDRVD